MGAKKASLISSSQKSQDLVFALVVPIGTDRELASKALTDHLARFRYTVFPIKLSERIPIFVPQQFEHYSELQTLCQKKKKNEIRRKNLLMDAGNKMREAFKSGDAVALAAVVRIHEVRSSNSGQDNEGDYDLFTSTAYIIDSLKHPDEIETLRAIYGPSFVAIGIYSPPATRLRSLIKDATTRTGRPNIDEIRHLMDRDENEQSPFGQRVRKAFELVDVVVDATRKKDVPHQISRVVELLFGHPYLTPTRQEYGMFLARTAQVRSASMARQVGAAILREDGSVVSIGTNEVAKPFGGQYWESDDEQYPEGRDHLRSHDSSDWFRHRGFMDILEKLVKHKAFNGTLKNFKADELFDILFLGIEPETNAQEKVKAAITKLRGIIRKSFFSDTIDYIRAVHAEMAAITDAARYTGGLHGHIMYVTTFPCHDCAKHIVASGLKEVIYFEAYPKSLVTDLYNDSIEVNESRPESKRMIHFHSFVGIAPSRYLELFSIGERLRKDEEGRPIPFDTANPNLQLPAYAPGAKAIYAAETEVAARFTSVFSSDPLNGGKNSNEGDSSTDLQHDRA